ncbi:MAG: Trm112 family protein [Terriglobales bacterium]
MSPAATNCGVSLRAADESLCLAALTPRYFTPRYNGAAMISQDLLDMLVCPVCKKPLVLKADAESLKCGECRRVYPIQDDIPIMLVDAATIDAA